MTEQTTSKPKRRYARDPKAAENAQAGPPPTIKSQPSTTSKERAAQTKIGKVIALLMREDGATLDEMVQTTGWLPHTTRAALTGLKKKSYAIERSQRDGASVYRITTSPA